MHVHGAAGLGEYFLYSGVHSVGVIEFEPPIFGPSSPAVLKPGMVISVDIPLFNTPWGACAWKTALSSPRPARKD